MCNIYISQGGICCYPYKAFINEITYLISCDITFYEPYRKMTDPSGNYVNITRTLSHAHVTHETKMSSSE